MEVIVHNQASEIPKVHQGLDRFAAQSGLAESDLTRIHLALEEHLANIVSHGYTAGQSGTIRVRFALDGAMLRIEIEDDARPFNPTEAREVDTSLPLEAKPLGGLGLLMMRKSVDQLEYRRDGGRNLLTIRKQMKRGS